MIIFIILGSKFLISEQRSIPDISGKRMSKSEKSIFSRFTISKASFALNAAKHLKPSSDRPDINTSKIDFSSSTIRMLSLLV